MKSLILASVLTALVAPALAAEPAAAEAELLAQRLRAEQLREEASEIRTAAEAVYARDDQACLPKLLVNACREGVREIYLAQIKIARDKEIEANRIDTAAKSGLNKLRDAERVRSRETQSAPAGIKPRPAASAVPAANSSKPVNEVPPPPTAQQEAAFAAAKQQRQQEAEAARRDEAGKAKARAAKAKEDRARYDERAKLIAERRAKRAEKAAGSTAIAP